MTVTTRAASWRFVAFLFLEAALLAGCDREPSAWKKAERQDTVEAYEGYLAAHVGGPHAREATQRLAERREDRDWRTAESNGTADAMDHYLAAYPQGRFAEEAKTKKGAWLETRDWAKAKATNSIESWESFLREYPQTQRRSEAEQALVLLQEARAWQKAEGTTTVGTLRSFVNSYPASRFKEQALARMRELALGEALAEVAEMAEYQGGKPVSESYAAFQREGSLSRLTPLERQAVLDVIVAVRHILPGTAFSLPTIVPDPPNGAYVPMQNVKLSGHRSGNDLDMTMVGGLMHESRLLSESIYFFTGYCPCSKSAFGNNPRFRGLPGSLLLRQQPGEKIRAETPLPRDRLLHYGATMLGRPNLEAEFILPSAEGSIYGVAGTLQGFFGDYTLVGDGADPLYIALLKDGGLTYLAGTGFVRAPDGTETRLGSSVSPCQEESTGKPGEEHAAVRKEKP